MAVVASHNAQAILHRQLESVETRGEDQVKVYVNPENPRKSCLINGSPAQLPVTLGLTAFMLRVGFLAWKNLPPSG